MNQVIQQQEKINEDYASSKDSSLSQVMYLLTQMIALSHQNEKEKELVTKREKNANIVHSWKITIVTLMVSLLGLGFTVYQFKVENEQKRKFQTQQAFQIQLQQQLQTLEKKINDKINKRDELNKAISGARNFIEVSRLYCKDGKYTGNQVKYSEKQIDDLYQIVNATFSINQIFDNTIYKQIRNFLVLFGKNRQPCNNLDDFELKFRELQGEINHSINNSIEIDQKQRELLANQLINSPRWKE